MPDTCDNDKVSLPASRQAGFLYWEFFLPDYQIVVRRVVYFFCGKKSKSQAGSRRM